MTDDTIKETRESEPCSYFDDGRTSRYTFKQASSPAQARALKFAMMESGHFGQGNYAFATDCDSCNACVPVRINTEKYEPTKKHVSILNRNKDLRLSTAPSAYDAELFLLFQRYLAQRHPQSDMRNYDTEDFHNMLGRTSHIISFRNPKNELVAACTVDVHGNAMNTEQVFYDHENYAKRSLGHFVRLNTIELAKLTGIQYIYEGAWAEDSPKIGHKSNITGLEVFRGGQWTDFDATPAVPITFIEQGNNPVIK